MALIHFIVNPLRPAIGLKWPYEEKRIETLTKDFHVHIIRGRLHAEILAREAMEANAKLIVCVAGDTTLSEIANGLYRAAAGGQSIPHLALHSELQRGDAVKSIPCRESFLEFLDAFLQNRAIEDKLDLGEIEFTGDYGQKIRRLFVNCGGFGFSASLVNRLARDYRTSRSRFSFFRLFAQLIAFYRFPQLDISLDSKTIFTAEEILMGLVHNGRYAGHGFQISPESRTDDGKFEYTLILKTFTYKYLLSIFPLFAGKLKSASFLKKGQCMEMRVSPAPGSRKVRIDFDGDSWGFLPATFRVLPKALPILR